MSACSKSGRKAFKKLPLLLMWLLPCSLAVAQQQYDLEQHVAEHTHRCDLEMQLVLCGLPAEMFPDYHAVCCMHWQHQGRRRVVYGTRRWRRRNGVISIDQSSSSSSSSSNIGSDSGSSTDGPFSDFDTGADNTIVASPELLEQLTAGSKNSSSGGGGGGGSSSSSSKSSLASIQDTELLELLRPDLDPNGTINSHEPNYFIGRCTNRVRVKVPLFTANGSIEIRHQRAPKRLSKDVIFKTKAYVMSSLRTKNLHFTDYDPVKATYKALRSFNISSGFAHPGGVIGPAELALMQHRLADNATLQELALKVLLTGAGVPPKTFNNGWKLPTDTPVNYAGPYVLVNVSAKYGGKNINTTECPQNYPAGAPKDSCAHISLVELDAQMTYKQALAFWATGNQTYAENALRIVRAWASNNQEFGDVRENGPLEASWAVASFARALELLRGRVQGWDETYSQFVSWIERLLLPQTDQYLNSTKTALAKGKQNVLANWHTTIAEAWMAVGVLTNDVGRYKQAVGLYHDTLRDYLKFGRTRRYRAGRVVGETSETLRDIFHTQFGLGGLLQVAEMAWQQDMDLYSAYDYALVAALELHAKIILADDDESQLPPGFKLLKSMPKPRSGCVWTFDMQRQLFYAKNKTSGAWVADLNDGVKYLQGITFLPTGWELGYNHFVGRLGLKMPQTAALIQRHYVDWYEMHWGVGTLSHANTAGSLWRAGLRPFTVCPNAPTSPVPAREH